VSNKARYEDILRRIQQKQAEEANQPKQDDLATVLADLNVLGFLEQVKRRPPSGLHVFGPKLYTSPPNPLSKHGEGEQIWHGALVWHKPKGYGQYQTLGLLGIWAVEMGEEIEVIVGTKTLTFSAPIYNAESYQLQMKRGFKTYYEGDASPPNMINRHDAKNLEKKEDILFQTPYDRGKRLELRDAVEAALGRWRAGFG